MDCERKIWNLATVRQRELHPKNEIKKETEIMDRTRKAVTKNRIEKGDNANGNGTNNEATITIHFRDFHILRLWSSRMILWSSKAVVLTTHIVKRTLILALYNFNETIVQYTLRRTKESKRSKPNFYAKNYLLRNETFAGRVSRTPDIWPNINEPVCMLHHCYCTGTPVCVCVCERVSVHVPTCTCASVHLGLNHPSIGWTKLPSWDWWILAMLGSEHGPAALMKNCGVW